MVMTRGRKRKEMAEETCFSATPTPLVPPQHQDYSAPAVTGLYTYVRRCIYPLNPCDSSTTPVRPTAQLLKISADNPLVNGWKVLLALPSSGQRADMPHENEAPNPLNCSSPYAEQDQRGNTTDATVDRRCISIGLTEVYLGCKKSLEDDEEVESAYKVDLVTVGKYRVKEEHAPMLRKIFAKYGDIAEDSDLSSSESFSHFLGMVCGICEELKDTTFVDITLLQVNEMLRKVGDSESVGLNVKWLSEKLTEVKEMKELVGGYNAFKQNRENMETKKDDLQKKKSELLEFQREVKAKLAQLQREVDLLTDVLATMKTKDEHTHQMIRKNKEKIIAYYNKDLLDGLL